MTQVVGPSSSDGFVTTMISRPQIGIDRLPVRRPSNEHKEAMNCKSCRKRKIKCNRLKPACEACRAFNCPCIYDAIPKKRGPKTDVLEALLKRVNGLEKRLKDKNKPEGSEDTASGQAGSSAQAANDPAEVGASRAETAGQQTAQTPAQPDAATLEDRSQQADTALPQQQVQQHFQHPQQPTNVGRDSFAAVTDAQETLAFTDALLDTYFNRLHGKPYYILDEAATRQRLRDGQLPRYVINAIHAVSIRYAQQLCGGYSGAAYSSQEYLTQARAEIDVDEPSIDHLQALLLMTMASFQNGKGKRSYMLLSHATSMALALSLHRELPSHLRIAPSEREGRRKLFWTCYLMDRFTASGSKRPSLIADESIYLRLPAWQPPGSHLLMDGSFFPNGSSLPYAAGAFNAGQGCGAMLVEIVRVLGITNRYLAAGGVKGDSHFPWHTQSTLSKIRSELDYWAASTAEAFGSIEAIFGHPDSSTLVLSKLIYHLVHCLIYRPFLPVDLAELSGSGQHQSWQIEATNLCFLHANAIAELVEIGKSSSIIDWPSFVGYCICTAGTIHVHGAHYMSIRDGDLFANSSEFLNREMAQLTDLRFVWAGVQHQRDTLQVVYASHSQLVKSLANNPIRYSPVFQMEDFFGRYPGSYVDGAHVTFADVIVDPVQETFPTYNGVQTPDDAWNTRFQIRTGLTPESAAPGPSHYMTQNSMPTGPARNKKRRTASSVLPYPTPLADMTNNGSSADRSQSFSMQTLAPPQQRIQRQAGFAESSEQTKNGNMQAQTFTQSVLSPTFDFSPMPANMAMYQPAADIGSHEALYSGQDVDHRTPGGLSAGAESAHTDPDKDPFLTLLEQLAENEGAGGGGMNDLDFFLNGSA